MIFTCTCLNCEHFRNPRLALFFYNKASIIKLKLFFAFCLSAWFFARTLPFAFAFTKIVAVAKPSRPSRSFRLADQSHSLSPATSCSWYRYNLVVTLDITSVSAAVFLFIVFVPWLHRSSALRCIHFVVSVSLFVIIVTSDSFAVHALSFRRDKICDHHPDLHSQSTTNHPYRVFKVEPTRIVCVTLFLL